MATLTIRDLDSNLGEQLQRRAARHGRSIGEEARRILQNALANEPLSGRSLVEDIRKRVEPLGGIDLELPAREPAREPPDFR